MASKKVLLVDDDHDSRTICSTILAHSGYTILQAEDGLEGVRLAREVKPDLILMDVTLPRLNGWQATEQIKGSPETSEILVVMLTARVMDADRALAHRAGCDSFLPKPCSPTRVLQEVKRLIGPPLAAE